MQLANIFYIQRKKKEAGTRKCTSGWERLAGVLDPPESCDIPKEAEFDGDYRGGSGGTGNG